MIELVLVCLTALLGYFTGAVPFGYLVGRWRGIDIFSQGSGNIGATNVGRVLGRRFGVLVFVLDFLKGALPTLAALALDDRLRPDLPPNTLPVTAGVAAFLGHLFPVFLRFRGGKGVATGAGVVAVLLPLPMLGALLAWLVVVSATRYVSLASLAAVTVLCMLRLGLTPGPWARAEFVLTLFCLLAALLVFARHQSNIRRLLAGTENRLRESSTMLSLTRTLHVLALGLWFGSAVFFSFVVGFTLFGTFEKLAARPAAERPLWFPVPEEYSEERRPSEKFPEPLRKEQGSRAAGAVLTPLFDWYFALQALCAVVALVTALSWSWSRFPQKVHRARTAILTAALVTVAAGWWLEWKVSALRRPRNEKTDLVLRSPSPAAEEVRAAEQARRVFGIWHGVSVLVNLVTIVLVTGAMALAAYLPVQSEQHEQTPAPGEQGRMVAVR